MWWKNTRLERCCFYYNSYMALDLRISMNEFSAQANILQGVTSHKEVLSGMSRCPQCNNCNAGGVQRVPLIGPLSKNCWLEALGKKGYANSTSLSMTVPDAPKIRMAHHSSVKLITQLWSWKQLVSNDPKSETTACTRTPQLHATSSNNFVCTKSSKSDYWKWSWRCHCAFQTS